MYNINEAYSMYRVSSGVFNNVDVQHCSFVPFAKYSPAYVTTNEDIRMIFDNFNPSGKRVLVNTGSGDAPMFYRAYGARDVDSFDISYCAKVMMDMKTAAIKTMSLSEYLGFLSNISGTKNFDSYSDIVDAMPLQSRNFIKCMNGCAIFSNGMGVVEEALPNKEEYKKMNRSINSSIPFIWSDLKDLHTHLHKQYDEIYLSNIFQYEESKENIVKILNNLRPFLSNGGNIIVHVTWFFRDWELDKYKYVSEKLKLWARMGLIRKRGQEVVVLQKMR